MTSSHVRQEIEAVDVCLTHGDTPSASQERGSDDNQAAAPAATSLWSLENP